MIGQMARDIGVTTHFIVTFAQGASHAYKTYSIRKKNGDLRTIDHPSKQLKAMQRWLLRYALNSVTIHPAAMAYQKKKSILDNANLHVGSRYLLRMDCKDFFPSITEEDLRALIASRPSGRASLAGLISYASGFDPDFVNSLITKYGHGLVAKARNVSSS